MRRIAPYKKRIAPRLASGRAREHHYTGGLPESIKYGLYQIARRERQSVSWVLEQIIIRYLGLDQPEYIARKPTPRGGGREKGRIADARRGRRPRPASRARRGRDARELRTPRRRRPTRDRCRAPAAQEPYALANDGRTGPGRVQNANGHAYVWRELRPRARARRASSRPVEPRPSTIRLPGDLDEVPRDERMAGSPL